MQSIQKQRKDRPAWIKAIANWSVQIGLWVVWTLAVLGTAFFSWHHDQVAHLPLNIVGMVIHCTVVGLVGLVVISYVELRMQPWRFYDRQ